MPRYCYRTDDDQPVELAMSMSEHAERERDGQIEDNGRILYRDLQAEWSRPGGNAFCGAEWPMKSDALGVTPEEVPEAMRDARRRGVNLNFDREGRAILENAAHRRQAMKAYGYIDKGGWF